MCRSACRTGRACTSRTNAQCAAVLLSARGCGGWLRANMVRWQLETRIKVQPFVPHSRSENKNNIELGATRYFSRHAWWSKWSF